MGHHGNPIVIGYTREYLKIWRELVARIMVGVGITEHDIIQVAFNYGLFDGRLPIQPDAGHAHGRFPVSQPADLEKPP